MGSSPSRNYGKGVQKTKTALDRAPPPHDSAEDGLYSNLFLQPDQVLGTHNRSGNSNVSVKRWSKGML